MELKRRENRQDATLIVAIGKEGVARQSNRVEGRRTEANPWPFLDRRHPVVYGDKDDNPVVLTCVTYAPGVPEASREIAGTRRSSRRYDDHGNLMPEAGDDSVNCRLESGVVPDHPDDIGYPLVTGDALILGTFGLLGPCLRGQCKHEQDRQDAGDQSMCPPLDRNRS